jgi:hypothetical protein
MGRGAMGETVVSGESPSVTGAVGRVATGAFFDCGDGAPAADGCCGDAVGRRQIAGVRGADSGALGATGCRVGIALTGALGGGRVGATLTGALGNAVGALDPARGLVLGVSTGALALGARATGASGDCRGEGVGDGCCGASSGLSTGAVTAAGEPRLMGTIAWGATAGPLTGAVAAGATVSSGGSTGAPSGREIGALGLEGMSTGGS